MVIYPFYFRKMLLNPAFQALQLNFTNAFVGERIVQVSHLFSG